jgi:hypothetical protein
VELYEDNEIPEFPSQDEIGAAINILINAAMNGDGMISGAVDRIPMPGQELSRGFSFHFELHDTRLCQHDVAMPHVGTLQ